MGALAQLPLRRASRSATQPEPALRAAPTAPVRDAVAEPLLAIDGVTLEYRSEARIVRATQDVSLQLHEGERLVLLGPSGCGKSTLLKAAAGFIEPVAGEVRLNGRRVQGPGPERMVVFQEFDQLPPWKTVRDNVLFPLLATKRLPRREAELRVREVLQQVGLLAFAGAFPHQLSGGMKQRVAIARALAMQPRVLLMDEPFAALDALTRRRMQQQLLQLWDEVGFTLLFVTHSIEEALILGSRVAVLSPHPGRLRAEVNAHAFGFDNSGSAEFQAAAERLHGLIFEGEEAAP